MCGIVAYIGEKEAAPLLIKGLQRLEYRGYESSGVASVIDGEMEVRKVKGRLMNLQEALAEKPLSGNIGIGHTRWATHGEPSDQNAHPQVGCKNNIALVHNGIVENYYTLKEELLKKKHFFKSNTDTEVIAHLIEENYEGDLPMLVCDPSQIERVFLNLIINAAEAMDDYGHLKLATRFIDSDEMIEIEISDTGHGIHPEDMEKIFDPFFTTKDVGHGTGLGLAISYGIIKAHQGNIFVSSELEKGTSFFVRLPLKTTLNGSENGQ